VLITKFFLARFCAFFAWVYDAKNRPLKIEKKIEKLSNKIDQVLCFMRIICAFVVLFCVIKLICN